MGLQCTQRREFPGPRGVGEEMGKGGRLGATLVINPEVDLGDETEWIFIDLSSPNLW